MSSSWQAPRQLPTRSQLSRDCSQSLVYFCLLGFWPNVSKIQKDLYWYSSHLSAPPRNLYLLFSPKTLINSQWCKGCSILSIFAFSTVIESTAFPMWISCLYYQSGQVHPCPLEKITKVFITSSLFWLNIINALAHKIEIHSSEHYFAKLGMVITYQVQMQVYAYK